MAVPLSTPSLNLLLSYSVRDEKIAQELAERLRQTLPWINPQLWHDEYGTQSQDRLIRALDQVDAVLLLVSHEYLAAKSIQWLLDPIIERHETQQLVAIPVVLDSCPWRDSQVGRLLESRVLVTPIVAKQDAMKHLDQIVDATAKQLEQIAQTKLRPQDEEPRQDLEELKSEMQADEWWTRLLFWMSLEDRQNMKLLENPEPQAIHNAIAHAVEANVAEGTRQRETEVSIPSVGELHAHLQGLYGHLEPAPLWVAWMRHIHCDTLQEVRRNVSPSSDHSMDPHDPPGPATRKKSANRDRRSGA